jgi:hypothetical protein
VHICVRATSAHLLSFRAARSKDLLLALRCLLAAVMSAVMEHSAAMSVVRASPTHLAGVLPQFHIITEGPCHVAWWLRREPELLAEATHALSDKNSKRLAL